MNYKNLARMYTETTGDSDITLTTAVPGCKTFANAGASDSGVYEYGLITYDLVTHRPVGSECGIGKYISSGLLFKRTTVESSTDSDDSAINLTGLTEIYLTPIASSLNYGANPFASYYQNGNTSVVNNTDGATVGLDAEWVEKGNAFSFSDSNDEVTINEPGWYQITGSVSVSAMSAFNGYVSVYTTQTSGQKKVYVTANAITYDIIPLNDTLIFIATTGTVKVKIDNHSGQTIDANCLELTITKKSDL